MDQENDQIQESSSSKCEPSGEQNENTDRNENICSMSEEAFCKGLERIVSLGADINALDRNQESVLHLFAKRDDIHAAETLVRLGARVHLVNNYEQNNLHLAAANRSHRVLRFLLQKGVTPDRRDIYANTPLMQAIKAEDFISAKILIKGGARKERLTRKGFTDLYLLIKTFREAAKELLVEPNLNLSYMDVYDAACQGDDELMRLLKEMGANFNVYPNHNVFTALHVCAAEGKEEALKRLVRVGADLELKDFLGNTPYDCAVGFGKKSIAQYINSMGANTSGE